MMHGLVTAVASLVAEHGLRGSGALALWHVGSSQTRAQTLVPCKGRQILNHWTTRKVPYSQF